MDILQNKSHDELLRSLLAEQAKALAEIRCAQKDISQAQNRLTFAIMLCNHLLAKDK